ncbi:MAG: class I tRNA ligase family protein, partial [Deltaproteobacteria bacterium]|nr:class I tRNA ligase family protein [Deltaproteobacteria bacterium]
RDVRMSEERIEGYKFFVNKIWNMAKFVQMNIEDYASASINDQEISLVDRWIKSRLNATVAEVIKALDEYRFNEAAAAIYQFIWHELCDWYVELVKPVLYGKSQAGSRRAAQSTLLLVLETSLKLLHPFMPFVSEEIWQHLISNDGYLMVNEFPVKNDTDQDVDAERQVSIIVEVITAIRNIRGEMGIAPSKKLKVIIHASEDESRRVISAGVDYIHHLANLEELSLVAEGVESKEVATAVVADMMIYVLLEGLIDIPAERSRLEKEIAKVDKDLSFVTKKLNNSDFRGKAAAAIVTKEEEKYRDLMGKHSVLEAALRKFQDIEPTATDVIT